MVIHVIGSRFDYVQFRISSLFQVKTSSFKAWRIPGLTSYSSKNFYPISRFSTDLIWIFSASLFLTGYGINKKNTLQIRRFFLFRKSLIRIVRPAELLYPVKWTLIKRRDNKYLMMWIITSRVHVILFFCTSELRFFGIYFQSLRQLPDKVKNLVMYPLLQLFEKKYEDMAKFLTKEQL